MPIVKKLGLYWGSTAFSIIESQQDSPTKMFRVPFSTTVATDGGVALAHTDDLKVINLLKESLRTNNITATETYLALSSKDIVIRSFVMPFLKPNEIKSVVEFEIKKYIPFNLKDLAYNFHAVPFTEDKVKRMRLHFVAIRKEIFDRYNALLKQAGLNVVFSEPAPMCLARALLVKKQIKFDQKAAVIQTDFSDCRILIVDNGIVQFVRDFQIQNPSLNAVPLDPEILKKKLFNEVKISLDFYSRQFKSEKIGEVLSLSFDPGHDLSASLQRELEMPVRKIDPRALINFSGAGDVGLINAYGATVSAGPKIVHFNLSGVVAASKPANTFLQQFLEDYLPAFKVAVVSAGVIAAVFFLTKLNVVNTKKQYDLMVERQGMFLDMPLDTIQQRITENQSKLQTYNNFFKKTEMTSLLVHISKLLPEGVWLSDMNIRYRNAVFGSESNVSAAQREENGISIELSGFAYDDDSNKQFKIVYGFVNGLKSDNLFKKYFQTVNLTHIQSEARDTYSVTSFRISCK